MKYLLPKLIILVTLLATGLFFTHNFSLATTISSSNTAKPTSGNSLRTGLVGWWTMDGADTTAVTTTDKSGQGNNGTRTATTITSGKIGQAMNFAGTAGNMVNLGYHSVLDITGSKSISTWIKTSNLAQNGAVVANSASGLGSIFFEGGLRWRGGGAITQLAYSIPSSLKDKWIHIAATQTGTNAVLYVNGVVVVSSTNIPALVTSAAKQAIGNLTGDAAGYAFNGSIDDVRIYNRALTSTEITALYKLGQGKIASSQTAVVYGPSMNTTLKSGLVGWWTMDGQDTTANTTTDKSGYGNNGTRTTVTPVGGKIGQAMKFNGSTSQVNVASLVPNIPINGPATFSGWYKFDKLATVKGASMSLGTNMYMHVANNGLYIAGTNDLFFPSISVGKWYHIVFVYSGNTGSSTLYVNNVVFPVQLQVGADDISAVSTFAIGNGGGGFLGLIDDVRIYSRALSATEITALYKLGQEKIASSQTAAPTNGNTLKNGLVGWWTLDGQDVNATQALDKSGLGNAGTRTATAITPGKIGQAMNFNGTTSRLVMGSTSVSTTGNFSLSAWIKTADLLNDLAIATEIGVSKAVGEFVLMVSAGKINFHRIDNAGLAGDTKNWASAANIPANKWVHVVAVYTGGTSSTLYINGISERPIPISNNISLGSAKAFHIGDYGTFAKFNGKIDDVRAYNRALSAADVMELYKMGK